MLVHRGPRSQSGRGIGSIFSALARGLAPIAKLGLRAGKSFLSNPLVRKVGQSALDVAKQSAINLSADLLEGKKMDESAQRELDNARQKIASTLRGGRKRKKHNIAKQKPAKRQRKITYSLLD
jgi:hypothetical protein